MAEYTKVEVTVCELDAACEKLFALRDEKAQIQEKLDLKNQEISDVEAVIGAFFEAHGKTKYHLDGRGTISLTDNFSFKTPKADHEREAFFGFLKEKGVFDQMITVNSQTLNAFCKAEVEAQLNQGNADFKIPGIEQPTIYKKVQVRK